MNPESIFEILELAHSQKRIVRLTLKSQRQLSVVLNGGLLLRPDGSNATSAFVAYVLPTRPEEALQKPSLILRLENFHLLHRLNYCTNDCSGYF